MFQSLLTPSHRLKSCLKTKSLPACPTEYAFIRACCSGHLTLCLALVPWCPVPWSSLYISGNECLLLMCRSVLAINCKANLDPLTGCVGTTQLQDTFLLPPPSFHVCIFDLDHCDILKRPFSLCTCLKNAFK